jgi:hypothetical protein
MSYRNETVHKAIIIPVVRTPIPRFLTVRDSRHKEWIFVTGGCKKSEIDCPLKCGLRELEEETRGVVNVQSGKFLEFQFESKNRSPDEIKKDRSDGVIVTLIYHVFVIDICVTGEEQESMIQRFHENKSKMDTNKRDGVHIKKAYDENDDISFDTLESFNKKPRWSLIVKNIIENPVFYEMLNSSNMQYFNIKEL